MLRIGCGHTEKPGNDKSLRRMNHERDQCICPVLGRHRAGLSWGAGGAGNIRTDGQA